MSLEEGVSQGHLGALSEELEYTTFLVMQTTGPDLNNREGSRVMLNFHRTWTIGIA